MELLLSITFSQRESFRNHFEYFCVSCGTIFQSLMSGRHFERITYPLFSPLPIRSQAVLSPSSWSQCGRRVAEKADLHSVQSKSPKAVVPVVECRLRRLGAERRTSLHITSFSQTALKFTSSAALHTHVHSPVRLQCVYICMIQQNKSITAITTAVKMLIRISKSL